MADEYEDRYTRMVACIEKLQVLLEELPESIWEKEEEKQLQIQETELSPIQDSCECIMDVDVKKPMSTLQEEFLTPNDETIISTIGVDLENPVSAQEEPFTTILNGETIISTFDSPIQPIQKVENVNIIHLPSISHNNALSIVSKDGGSTLIRFRIVGYALQEDFFLSSTENNEVILNICLCHHIAKEESCVNFMVVIFHGLCWYLEEIT